MPFSQQGWFRSLGMITQMNLIMIPLVAIIVSLFIVAQVININLTGYQFQQASRVLLSNNNNKYYIIITSDLTVRLERLVRISKNLLNIDGHKAQSMNLLYNKSFENTGSNYSQEVIGQANKSYSKYELIQYNVYGQPITADYYSSQFVNFTSVVNTLILTFDLTKMFTTNNLILVSNSSSAIFATSPSISYTPKYNPYIRPWYIEQVNYQKQYGKNLYITSIFQRFSIKEYSLSIQNSLMKNGFRGLISLSVDFNQMLKQLSVTQDNMMLIYNNGTILFQNAYTDYVLYEQTSTVYDQNMTGFNLDQWNTFKQASTQSPFSNILITYNTVFEQDMTINIHKFPKLPLYLLIFTNLEENKNSEANSQQIVDSLRTQQLTYMIIVIVLDICLFILLSYLMIYTIKPIKRIQWHVQNSARITQSNTMFLAKVSNNQLLNLEFELIQLILRMKQSPMNKSDLCKDIEKFQWTKRNCLQSNIFLDNLPDGCQLIERRINVFKLMMLNYRTSN